MTCNRHHGMLSLRVLRYYSDAGPVIVARGPDIPVARMDSRCVANIGEGVWSLPHHDNSSFACRHGLHPFII